MAFEPANQRTDSPERGEFALIIGAGPAGLTAAHELLTRSQIKPIVIERDSQVGGISRTVDFKGNKIDIGGHRFFSKSARVNEWWGRFFPVQGRPSESAEDPAGPPLDPDGPDPDANDRVFLVRRRLSRIYFLRHFFEYPVSLSFDLVRCLGFVRTLRILRDYLMARIRPVRPERSLEDFLINRFGRHLYRTFFKDYTEKLWGVPCSRIKPEWGAQRIKGLSLRKAVCHALKRDAKGRSGADIETTLIGRFHYPKYGPGQMWEAVAETVRDLGGVIHLNSTVENAVFSGARVSGITVKRNNGEVTEFRDPAWVFSSMAVKDLLAEASGDVPGRVRKVAGGLEYRDFITVGLLCRRRPEEEQTGSRFCGDRVDPPDNWLYIQDPGVRLGRVQIFNNWSPYLVRDPDMLWLGLEYFATEGDDLWTLDEGAMIELAKKEIEEVGLMKGDRVEDAVVIRQPKAYPAYFGTYEDFGEVRAFADSVENLFMVGRNGTHRYNNQDHSMLSAMTAVDSILDPRVGKHEVWSVNSEDSYHEGGRAS